MRAVEHDLNSLRKLVRELQQENGRLKALLVENNIAFDREDVFQNAETVDEYDEDQGSRILPLKPDDQMAREFFGMFWGRTDVFAKRGKKVAIFPNALTGGTIRFAQRRIIQRRSAMRTVNTEHGNRLSGG